MRIVPNFTAACMVLASLNCPAAVAATMDIALVEKTASNTVTDLGEKGDSVGDLLTFNNEVFENDKSAGRDNGWCIRTIVGKAWECTLTTRLTDGQITLQGTLVDGEDSVLVVTGGTGAFSQADGKMLLHARNAEKTEHDLLFKLLRAAVVVTDDDNSPN